MSDLRAVIAEYLSVRRSLGYKLKWDALLLAEFADFCERANVATVTTDVALTWAKAPVNCSQSWWANRLTVVRVFARYLRAIDPAAEVPPVGLIPVHGRLERLLGALPDQPLQVVVGGRNRRGRGQNLILWRHGVVLQALARSSEPFEWLLGGYAVLLSRLTDLAAEISHNFWNGLLGHCVLCLVTQNKHFCLTGR